VNESDFHKLITNDKSFKLVYVNHETHAPVLVFRNDTHLKIVKVYLLEDYVDRITTLLLTEEGIVLKSLEIDLRKNFDFGKIEKMNIQTFTIRKMYNYILLKVESKILVYEIDMEGIEVTCNLNG